MMAHGHRRDLADPVGQSLDDLVNRGFFVFLQNFENVSACLLHGPVTRFLVFYDIAVFFIILKNLITRT